MYNPEPNYEQRPENQKKRALHNIIYQYSSKISKAKKSEESFWAKED